MVRSGTMTAPSRCGRGLVLVLRGRSGEQPDEAEAQDSDRADDGEGEGDPTSAVNVRYRPTTTAKIPTETVSGN